MLCLFVLSFCVGVYCVLVFNGLVLFVFLKRQILCFIVVFCLMCWCSFFLFGVCCVRLLLVGAGLLLCCLLCVNVFCARLCCLRMLLGLCVCVLSCCNVLCCVCVCCYVS